jgi:AGZA family xanthine/uracil permease-like MFS transporter
MWDRWFGLTEHGTTVRRELFAGLTTFLTMAYIIFVQPAVLADAGMDPDAVTAATCISAALASAIMGLYGRYPIAQAPGMGENFFFTFSLVPAAAAMLQQEVAAGNTAAAAVHPWQVGLGVIFLSGLIFLAFSLLGLREMLLESISPSMRHAIAAGIGAFIALIGLHDVGLVVFGGPAPSLPSLNYRFASPDLIVFFAGLFLTTALVARGVRGAIFWGILASTAFVVALKLALPAVPAIAESALFQQSDLATKFTVARRLVDAPPSVAATAFQMDVVRAASWPMLPFVLIFFFMVVFDTLGTLVGVAEQAGFIRDNKLPRARQAFASDAIGTVVGATLGTSTVTSYIESTAGVQVGGRTGLTALTAGGLFLLAMFFHPVIAMVGSYKPITAPALVVVGSMMMAGLARIAWSNAAEAIPSLLILLGIPLTYSIADGLALGFISYPIVKLLAGQHRDVRWLMYLVAAVLVAYFVVVRAAALPGAG